MAKTQRLIGHGNELGAAELSLRVKPVHVIAADDAGLLGKK